MSEFSTQKPPFQKALSSPEMSVSRGTLTPPRNASNTPSRSSSSSSARIRQLTERIVVIFEELPLNMSLLRNEESQLIEVMETHGKARSKGIRVGDSLIEINGKKLEIGFHHDRIAAYVSKATFPLRFTFWRSFPGKRYVDTVVGWDQIHSSIAIVDSNNPEVNLLSSSPTTTLKNASLVLTEPRSLNVSENGHVYASEVVSSQQNKSVSLISGDLLVGFHYAPFSPTLTGSGLLEILTSNNNVHINIWRLNAHGRCSPLSPSRVKRSHKKPLNSIKSPNSEKMEVLASEAPLSLSSMMNMMGSVGDYLPSTSEGSMINSYLPTAPTFGTSSSSVSNSSPVVSAVETSTTTPANIFGRRMHYTDDVMSDQFYATSSECTPWIFEQSVWCGAVECEWHSDQVEEDEMNEFQRRRTEDSITDQLASPQTSPRSSPSTPGGGGAEEVEDSPRRRTSSFHSLTPRPLRRKSRDGNDSDLVIDVTILLTEAAIYFIHPQAVNGHTPYKLALKITPEMILDVALPYYTVQVNGDEVAVRSSEVQLRLKEDAIPVLEQNTSSQWKLLSSPTTPSSSPQFSTPKSISEKPPTPPWQQTIDKGEGAELQHSIIICTASNLHRAELLETITTWYEDVIGEYLSVEQVPYLGSPPAARTHVLSGQSASPERTPSVREEEELEVEAIAQDKKSIESNDNANDTEEVEEDSATSQQETAPKIKSKHRGSMFQMFKRKSTN